MANQKASWKVVPPEKGRELELGDRKARTTEVKPENGWVHREENEKVHPSERP